MKMNTKKKKYLLRALINTAHKAFEAIGLGALADIIFNKAQDLWVFVACFFSFVLTVVFERTKLKIEDESEE